LGSGYSNEFTEFGWELGSQLGNIRAILKAEGAWEQGSSSVNPPQRLSWLKPSCLGREETGYLPSIAGCNKRLRK